MGPRGTRKHLESEAAKRVCAGRIGRATWCLEANEGRRRRGDASSDQDRLPERRCTGPRELGEPASGSVRVDVYDEPARGSPVGGIEAGADYVQCVEAGVMPTEPGHVGDGISQHECGAE